MDKNLFYDALKTMAQYGTAPTEGCKYFGVGYENVFEAIVQKYFYEQFGRNICAQKFVIGPYGSGKTHFLRQLMEVARDENCVTSEVSLSKDINFLDKLLIYSEVVRNIRAPLQQRVGIHEFLKYTLENIINDTKNPQYLKQKFLRDVDSGIFKSPEFRKVIKIAVISYLNNDMYMFELSCDYLLGNISDNRLCKELGVAKITKSAQNKRAEDMLVSLFQFVYYIGYRGMVVAFDEAEQSFNVDRKKLAKIFSTLRSLIDATVNLKDASALIVYAMTNDVYEEMNKYPALQQRLSSPYERDFFSGNVLAPIIDLTRLDSIDLSKKIALKISDVFYETFKDQISISKDELLKKVDEITEAIIKKGVSSSNKREITKAVCTYLLEVLGNKGQNNEMSGRIKAQTIFEDEV
ncbi:BREX system ATP-binding domain-containing protein [Anaerocellum danielii]|uniref:DUF2791 family P-loop domain-containing protein n=1 Tax=Anaerocellum danielii TaxID=1387557 RepID=A0ABZ0TWJ1_9FIRM|nr:BREX system ATP-binding domain-containing protein [Caldicellulosiruptor danielii]WPX07810.1 DUF2791 family P-loop domain-containing protein [Caldicellulosiruptor danielii]